ncbi:MAG: glycosyltransferase, partial [Limisphaerales bacterium]
MNILWISPTPSHPQNAGNRAHIHALGSRILSAGHTVTFLLYDQENSSSIPGAIDAMRGFWTKFIVVHHRLRNRAKTNGDDWGVDDWFNEDIASAVRYLVMQEAYDAVICEYIFFSKALTLLDGRVLKILNCHDRMSNRAQLLQRNGVSPDFFYTTPDQEKIALDRADLILAIQEDEKHFFQTLTSRCVMELGHPVEVDLLPSYRRRAGVLRVDYLGSANSLNRKSLEVFLAAFRNRPALAPKVKLILAGDICNSVEDPDIERLGFVENERDFFSKIDLFVNPMIDGTGLKIKTLSAIRHGVPFLATIPASVGIPVAAPEHTCTSIESLIDYLEGIVSDPQKRLSELKEATLDCLNAYQHRIDQQFDQLLRALTTRSIAHLRRKRVLLVTDIPFWEPGVGNQSRILALCHAIKMEFDLRVFFFGSIWPAREKAIAAAGLDGLIVSYKDYETAAK